MESDTRGRSLVHQRMRLADRLNQILVEMALAGLTYQEIADQLNTTLDTIKNIVTGRVKKPRNKTLDQIVNRLRSVVLLNLSEDVSILAREVLEGHDAEIDFSPYEAFESVFRLGKDAQIRFADKVFGEYACYRFSGSGKTVVKSKFVIDPFDERKGMVTASLEYITSGGNSKLIQGFAWPVGNSTLFFGSMLHEDDIIMMSVDGLVEDPSTPKSGVLMYKSAARKSFGARLACMKIQSSNRGKFGTSYGHMEYDRILNEIGSGIMKMMRNSSDEYSILRSFSDE